MSKEKIVIEKATSSFPVFGVLGILLVCFKIFEVIDWSWWLVLLPFYVVPAFVFGFIALILVGAGLLYSISAVLEWNARRKNRKYLRNRTR